MLCRITLFVVSASSPIFDVVLTSEISGGPRKDILGNWFYRDRTMFALVRSSTLLAAVMWIVLTNSAFAQWDTISHSNERRYETTTVVHNGKMVVLNGFNHRVDIINSVEVYDPATNVWTLKSSTEVALENAVTHAGNVLVGDEIWLIGGRVGDHPGSVSNKVWIYNINGDTWRSGPQLPKPFAGGGAAFVNGRIHAFGGLDPQARCDVDHHFVYDTTNTEGWVEITATAAMPMARNHFSTVVFNQKIYALGGQNNHDKCFKGPTVEVSQAHVYDPVTSSWNRLKDLPFPRSHSEPASFLHNNKIYIVGGRTNGKKVISYSPLTDMWIVEQKMELPVSLMAPSARIFGNKLYVAMGGENLHTNASTATRVLDLSDDDIPDVPTPTTPQVWTDSYSVDGQCYCDSTYDHNVGEIIHPTPLGDKTVVQICTDIQDKLGFGAQSGRVYYNTVQCGHGPVNQHKVYDEWTCPGIPIGVGNYTGPRCFETGARWNLDAVYDGKIVPSRPVLQSPVGGAGVPSDTPVRLVFLATTHSQEYVVQRFDRSIKKWNYSKYHSANNICTDEICSVVVEAMVPQLNAAWRVQAVNDAGAGPFSDNALFHVVANSEPVKPKPISPLNRVKLATHVPVDLVFSEVPGSLQYTVQRFDRTVGKWTYSKSHNADTICTHGVCTVTVSGVNPQINAAWRVRSVSESGTGSFSAIAYFDVVTVELEAVPQSPINRAGVASNVPVELSFAAVTGAQRYTVQRFDRTLSKWSYSKTHRADNICSGGSCSVTVSAMAAQKNAAWRVRAINDATTGAFSDIALFDVVGGS